MELKIECGMWNNIVQSGLPKATRFSSFKILYSIFNILPFFIPSHGEQRDALQQADVWKKVYS